MSVEVEIECMGVVQARGKERVVGKGVMIVVRLCKRRLVGM